MPCLGQHGSLCGTHLAVYQPSCHYLFDLGSSQFNKRIQVTKSELDLYALVFLLAGLLPTGYTN